MCDSNLVKRRDLLLRYAHAMLLHPVHVGPFGLYLTVRAIKNGEAGDMLETNSMLSNGTSGRGFSRVLL